MKRLNDRLVLMTALACISLSANLLAESSFLSAAANSQHRQFRSVDDVFIFPDGGQKFDSELWKKDIDKRYGMIFDLYHLPISRKPSLEVFALLGNPLEIKNEFGGGHSAFSAYYDLGNISDCHTYLSILFKDGLLDCFSIQQRSGFSSKKFPDWQEKNLSWNTIADEYNRDLYLVGMPVKLISVAIGFIPTESSSGRDQYKALVSLNTNNNVHSFGPFEFEYSSDGIKVARFRISYQKDNQTFYTDWVSNDCRSDSRCLVRHSEYFNLQECLDPFVKIGFPFSRNRWNGTETIGRGNSSFNIARNAAVMDLVRSYPIIGMTRDQLHDLLSKPSSTRTQPEKFSYFSDPTQLAEVKFVDEVELESKFNDVEDYLLSASGCGNTGENYLEIAYEHNVVRAFRLIHKGGERIEPQGARNFRAFSYFNAM